MFLSLSLLVSLPIDPWSPIVEIMLVNTYQVFPSVNTAQVSRYLEAATTAFLAPIPIC